MKTEQNSSRTRRRTSSNSPDESQSLPSASDGAAKKDGSPQLPVTQDLAGQQLPDTTGLDFESMTVWEKINWVRGHLPTSIVPDKTVSMGSGSYDVVTHQLINSFLRPMMSKAGLIDYCSLRSVDVWETGMVHQSSGRKTLHYRGQYDYVIVNAHDGDQKAVFMVEGWGEDGGDKGPGKAHTYAIKTGRKQAFSIAAGDAEEERTDDIKDGIGRPPVDLINPAQMDELLKLADELFGDESEKALKHLCDSQSFMLTALNQMPAKYVDSAKTLLTRWKGQRSKDGQSDDLEA